MFTREQALAALKAVGRDADLMTFAQRLIDDGIVGDVEQLETLAGQAMTRAQVGPPEGNPLIDDTAPPVDTAPSSASTAPSSPSPTTS